MARHILKVEFALSDFENKKDKDLIVNEIKTKICALLNTNGGSLVLIVSDATTDKTIYSDDIKKAIEDWLVTFVGLPKTEKNFNWESSCNTITINIAGLPILCSLSTNFFLPIQSGIYMLNDANRIRELLFERRVVDIPRHTVPEQYDQGCDSDLRESHCVQLKNLNSEKTNSLNLAGRIIKQKLTSYVSGFANCLGGQIFYGIDDKGFAFGQSLRDEKEIEQIKTKVGNAIRKMIWPAELGEIQCGKQWDIKFVPVKNCNNESLPLTFVIVISVLPCFGGVFVMEPESYHVVDGEVKTIPFDTWKEKIKTRNKKHVLPIEMKRQNWSSRNSEMFYMNATQTLVEFRHGGQWDSIKKLAEELETADDQKFNSKRIAFFHLIAVHYRKGDFKTAENYLEKLRNRISTNEDKDNSITCLGERYSASAIERSRKKYLGAWKIIEEGLQRCGDVPAGLIPAAYYTNAASVLSKLVDNESFIGISREDKCFEDKVQENVKKVEKFCDWALEHVELVKDDFKIAKEELNQRINIALASLYLRSESHSQVSLSDISKAGKKIDEADNSLKQQTKRLEFNYCRMLLVKSDRCLRHYQLKKTDIDNKLKTEFLEHLEKAKNIAKELGFKEITKGCEDREDQWEKIELTLEEFKDNEKEIDERKSYKMLVSEWLNPNDQ